MLAASLDRVVVGGEVVIDRADADAGALRDLRHRRRGHPLLGMQCERGLDDAPARLLRRFAAPPERVFAYHGSILIE